MAGISSGKRPMGGSGGRRRLGTCGAPPLSAKTAARIASRVASCPQAYGSATPEPTEPDIPARENL